MLEENIGHNVSSATNSLKSAKNASESLDDNARNS